MIQISGRGCSLKCSVSFTETGEKTKKLIRD